MTDTDLLEQVKQQAADLNGRLAANWRRENARKQLQAKANALGKSDQWVDEQMARLIPCHVCGYLMDTEECPRDHQSMVSHEGVW